MKAIAAKSFLIKLGAATRNFAVKLRVAAKKYSAKIVLAVLLTAVFLLIASYFLSMLIGLALFFSPAGTVFRLDNSAIFIQFLFAWIVFWLGFVAAYRMRRSFREVISRAFKNPFEKLFDNWLVAMPMIAGALSFIVSSIIDLQDIVNVPTGSLPVPTTDAETFLLFFDLTRAPIIEEFMFRIIPIGIIVLTRLLLTQTGSRSVLQRLKLGFLSFLFPDKAKQMAGEKSVNSNGIVKGISKDEWAILNFTSLVFALAHILSGIGWQYGKVTSTFVQGLVFGIAFLAYGFQAGILLHWFFNYYFYALELGNHYLGLNFNLFSWIDTLTLLLGIVFTIVFFILMLRMLVPRGSQKNL